MRRRLNPLRNSILTRLLKAGLIVACVPCAQSRGQNPPAANPAKPADIQTASVSKHHPILVIAQGSNPTWNLRLGMKGPERLDRAGYPPIVLEPAEITAADSGGSWAYRARDIVTGTDVTVTLVREACSDSGSDTKFTFRVVVNHAQIGALNGCGQTAPEKFREFRKKNQLDPTDAPDDKDKKTVLDPITNAKAPIAVAYMDAAGKIVVSHGTVKRVAAPSGLEPDLSHDGKKLLYTRSDSKNGPERTIVLFDSETSRSTDLVSGIVRQAFWSPDDSHVAFLKFVEQKWQLWMFPAGAPEKAAVVSEMNFSDLQGWATTSELIATDNENAYWIGDDGKVQQTIPLKEIYGGDFEAMGGDTIRVHPQNPDLLLVSAYWNNSPPGAPSDSMSLTHSFFLYEIRAKRRTVLCPLDAFARFAVWSRDGLQVYFTRMLPSKALITQRILWDGSGLRRYDSVSNLVIGK
jgi:uncharacterized membrane protein